MLKHSVIKNYKNWVVLNEMYSIFFKRKQISNIENSNVIYLKVDEIFIVKVYFIDESASVKTYIQFYICFFHSECVYFMYIWCKLMEHSITTYQYRAHIIHTALKSQISICSCVHRTLEVSFKLFCRNCLDSSGRK